LGLEGRPGHVWDLEGLVGLSDLLDHVERHEGRAGRAGRAHFPFSAVAVVDYIGGDLRIWVGLAT
jgi:hypothetical protein